MEDRAYSLAETYSRDGNVTYHCYWVDVDGSQAVPVVQNGQDKEPSTR
jgi:hypothetical protein